MIERRPGTVFAVTLLLMTPFAVLGVVNYNRLSYGLLSELQPHVTSVIGAREVKDHFPAGMTGITSVLLKNPDFAFSGRSGIRDGEEFSEALTERLRARSAELGLADIRSQTDPLGTARADQIPRDIFSKNNYRNRAQRAYVSTGGPLEGQVTRVDLVFDVDPFSRETIGRLTSAEAAVHEAIEEMAQSPPDDDAETRKLYASLPEKTEILLLGATASLRDLKKVTDRDRVVIAIMVTSAVYLVLIALLGRPAISLYLIATVLFSYLVTLGVTHAVYWSLSTGEYTGIDWKAPDLRVHDPGGDGRGLQRAPHGAGHGRTADPRTSQRRVGSADEDGSDHLQLRDHYGRDIRLADDRHTYGDHPIGLCTGIRRAARHVRRPPNSRPDLSGAPVQRPVRPAGDDGWGIQSCRRRVLAAPTPT